MLSGADLSNQLAVDVSSVAGLRMKAASGDPAAIRAAARQFEAMLVQTMLKSVRNSSLAGEGDAFGNSSDMKLYQEMLDQQWAQSIVAGKGLGLADMLMRRLQQDAGLAGQGAQDTGKPAQDKPMPDKSAMTAPLAQIQAQVQAQPGHRDIDQAADDGHGAGTSPEHRNGNRKQRFIEAMLPHAKAAEKATGVPAEFILAHAALESGWGRHEIAAADGTRSHNLFGIKAGAGWNGGAVETVTTEYKQGLPMKVLAKFRAYADYAESFIDYARLLKHRYSSAVQAGGDAIRFSYGLLEGGYATDPAYATKLLGTLRSLNSAGV